MDFFTKQKSALWLIVILIIMNLIILSLLLLPGGFHRPPMRRASDPKERGFIGELNLTPEQESQFWQYRNAYFEVIKEYTDQINNKKYQLMQMLFQREPDNQQLNTLADELGQLYAEFEKARFGQILRFKTILTDVQFNVFKKIVSEAYKPRPGDMDRGGPPPEFDGPHGPPPPSGDKHRPGDPPPPRPR